RGGAGNSGTRSAEPTPEPGCIRARNTPIGREVTDERARSSRPQRGAGRARGPGTGTGGGPRAGDALVGQGGRLLRGPAPGDSAPPRRPPDREAAARAHGGLGLCVG